MKTLFLILVVLFIGISSSADYGPITMRENANITLDGGKILNFRSEPDVGTRALVMIDNTTARVMMREPAGEWACVGNQTLENVCCRSNMEIYGSNSTGAVWEWDGEEWTLLSTSPAINDVSICSDGTLFARQIDGNHLLEWNGTAWQDHAGVILDIAAFDASCVYAIGGEHTTYGHLWLYNGTDWTNLDAITEIDSVSVAKDGSLFAILHSGELSKWSGTAWETSLGGVIEAIAVKSATMVWATSSNDDTIWYWNGLTWIQSSSDKASRISISNF